MRRQDYTVGWICAVPTEYLAACELLDEEHPSLPTDSPHDGNAYTLGRIGDHHVVIACLPQGRYGIASAAGVAKDMLRSFEFIRIGLMVGIGGGAPSDKHDIRLGDIVVGCPVKKEGGVVPYNFGKAIQDQELKRTGSLNSPPTVLLTELTRLSTSHKRKGVHIAESVRSIIAKNPRLQGEYQRPGAEHDSLYESRYIHQDRDQSCEVGCSSASPPLLQRPRRKVDPDEPVVHYGLIASADQLMKDAAARDRLIKEHDILCFEMEAAGLMNDFPCVVIRGICDYSDSHKNDAWQGYAALIAASYAKELLCIIPRLQITHIPTATAEIVKPLFSIPYNRDGNFIDRETIFVQIEEQLRTYHRVSLYGIGGVGKSQIAIEYAYRYQKSRPQSHVFWVYAATSATFMQSYHDIARSLKLPGCDEPKTEPYELVSQWLKEEDHSWLMILDNADNAALFFPRIESDALPTTIISTERPLIDYLPTGLGSQKLLLITTRSRLVGQDLAYEESCVEVQPFSSPEAKDLLRLKMKGATGSLDICNIERLLDTLGYVPLAITQAAAFIKRNRWTFQGYLEALEKDNQNLTDHLSQELQDPRRPRGLPNSVFRTWKISFDQIQAQEPQAAKLLSLIAMLDPQRIPERLLRPLAEREVDFRMAIGTLDGFSLLKQEIGGDRYAIHPIVQASVQYWLDQRSEKSKYASQALRLLAGEFPNGEHENKEICESMLVHAQAVLGHNCISENDLEHRGTLLFNMGWFHWRQGRYTSAYHEVSEAYDIDRARLGEVTKTTLARLSMLALVLQYQGKYEAAEEMNRRALEGREKVLGVEHPETLTSISNLALVLQVQGKYEAAEEMNRRALDGYKKVLGVEHPHTLTSVNNLASVLQGQGKNEAAEKIHRRALEGCEKVLGVEHPDTLTIMNNLASVLQDQGKYEVAKEMHHRALEGCEKILGVEHPHTLTIVYNLALVLQHQGKYEAAEEIHRRALEGREKVLGVEHPHTLTSVNNLASVLQDQGKYEAAEKMHHRALEGYKKVLGVEHPDTLTSVSNLASVLQLQGKYEAAEEIHRRALEGREKVLGVEHPNTLSSVNNLASVLQDQGKYEAAEEMLRRALEGCEKVLGVEHPHTLFSFNNLAMVLQDQGKYEAAEELHRRALEGCEKVLGVEHPDTLISVSNLALLLRYQGKYKAAEEMNRRALEGREKVLGVEHPHTLTSVSILASVLQDQGKYEAAEKMHRRALEGYKKVLGVEHPDTLTSVSNLALVLRYQGKYEAAEEMHRRALEGCEKVLGVEHPRTLASVDNLASVLRLRDRVLHPPREKRVPLTRPMTSSE